MSDYPPDVPRLRTIERYLLIQLAAVRRAIEAAERPEPAPPPTRWCLVWHRTPAGQPRVAVLHRAGCILATGRPVDALAIAAVHRAPDRALEPCDVCHPDPEA